MYPVFHTAQLNILLDLYHYFQSQLRLCLLEYEISQKPLPKQSVCIYIYIPLLIIHKAGLLVILVLWLELIGYSPVFLSSFSCLACCKCLQLPKLRSFSAVRWIYEVNRNCAEILIFFKYSLYLQAVTCFEFHLVAILGRQI